MTEQIFRPLLAAQVNSVENVKFPVMASPKLDGIRCLIVNGVPVSRSLKPIPNDHIQRTLKGLPNFDGELIVGDPARPDTWNQTSSAVMRHDGKPDFHYYVFDVHSDSTVFAHRYMWIAARAQMYKAPCSPLKHTFIETALDLQLFEETCVADGYEGVMIRDPRGPYKHGRSTLKEGILLKLKRFMDAEAVIVGMKERMRHIGPATVNELGLTERDSRQENLTPAGDLGAFVCHWVNGDPTKTFEVGTGFTASDRKAFWDDASLVGRQITIKFQNVTPDAYPRFPVFVRFRED